MSHKNVIAYLGMYHQSGRLYILTEWASGGSLRRMLKHFGPMKEGVAGCYARQILSALAHIHERGVAHRDIKPGNVLVDHRGVIKVADFGVSRWVQSAHVTALAVGAAPDGPRRRRKVRPPPSPALSRPHSTAATATPTPPSRAAVVLCIDTERLRRPPSGRRHATVHESGARRRCLRR